MRCTQPPLISVGPDLIVPARSEQESGRHVTEGNALPCTDILTVGSVPFAVDSIFPQLCPCCQPVLTVLYIVGIMIFIETFKQGEGGRKRG